MKTDRELLMLAAKAAGIAVDGWVDKSKNIRVLHPKKPPRISVGYEWNPLTDDGDDARLEAKLGLNVYWYPAMVLVGPEVCSHATGSAYAEYFDRHNGDKQAARRRAGVRAAAAIGEAL